MYVVLGAIPPHRPGTCGRSKLPHSAIRETAVLLHKYFIEKRYQLSLLQIPGTFALAV